MTYFLPINFFNSLGTFNINPYLFDLFIEDQVLSEEKKNAYI